MADDRVRCTARGGLAAAVTILVIAGVSGCGSDDSTADGGNDRVTHNSRPGEKTGSGEMRDDLKPLTKRFDALGTPKQATWMSGTLGTSDAPGPTSYWIDAVVTLEPDEASALKHRYAAKETSKRPDVADELSGRLPASPLLASDRLDKAFSESGFVTQAYLDPGSDQVVLTAKGQ